MKVQIRPAGCDESKGENIERRRSEVRLEGDTVYTCSGVSCNPMPCNLRALGAVRSQLTPETEYTAESGINASQRSSLRCVHEPLAGEFFGEAWALVCEAYFVFGSGCLSCWHLLTPNALDCIYI